jgi:arylsulfatase A-like enzyme
MMKKKTAYFFLFLFILFLAGCHTQTKSEFRFYRFIDHLQTENIVECPLLDHLEKPTEIKGLYPSESRPLSDMGSGQNPFGIKRKIKLGATDRNILFCPPNTRLDFSIDRLEGSVLEFGIGLINHDKQEDGAEDLKKEKKGVFFFVFVEAEGSKKRIFQKYLPLPPNKESPEFSWHSLDLPVIKKSVRLSFVTEGEEESLSFWFNPLLYERQEKTTNVILISIDTLRADHLGCYGYERDTSPQIDQLAEDSVTFLNTYASSPWTLPSHVSLLTSLHNAHHQVYYEDDSMDPSLVTLADKMRKDHFCCAAFTGGGFVSSDYGFSKGFDAYGNDERTTFRQDAAEHLFRLVSGWLDQQKGKNFFLFLHTYQPHNPYACPYPYKTMFLGKGARWRQIDLISHLGGNPGIFKTLPAEELWNIVGLYDGEIRYTDEKLIGPLIQKLKDMGMYDQTMIIFTSDHGEEFYEHHGWGHGHSLYDESLKVPLIIKFPQSQFKGQRIDDIVSLVDIFPTVLEETGIDFSALEIDGQSLLPLIKGKEKGDRTFLADIASNVLASHIPQRITLNRGREKLILNKHFRPEDLSFFISPPPDLGPVELYNLALDPGEKQNIADNNPQVANQFIQRIDAIYEAAMKRETKKLEMDEELKKRLKALGYIR